MMRYTLAVAISALGCSLMAQEPCEALQMTDQVYLEKTLRYLASDSLEGRYPGTEEDYVTRAFIESELRSFDLEPVFEEAYQQSFSFPDEVKIMPDTRLSVNGNTLSVDKEYYPVKWSANATVAGPTVHVKYGIVAPELERDDLKDLDLVDKVAVMNLSSPDGIHPHSEYAAYHDIGERLKLLKERGAAAALLINPGDGASDPRKDYNKIENSGLPVLFVNSEDAADELKEGAEVSLQVAHKEIEVTTANVAGYLENGEAETVVIGAHFDHLGFGGSSSLYRGEPQIHNGADDNASGTAGLLTLAKFLAQSEDPRFAQYNYLLVAFGAEEKGLLGSSYFVEHTDLDRYNIRYMLNMDMVGRLDENTLAVNGVGTSPDWKSLLQESPCDLETKLSETGVGPSDHTSFYYDKKPVLHFFTGTHSDYHKPTDDADKINYEGELKVLNFMLNLIARSAGLEEIMFSTTKEEKNTTPRFSVTLGVMPDYMYSGDGMRIDNVSPGKTADAAGLEAGDVVIQMGDISVTGMQSYMKALSAFKKGDSTTVVVKRDGEEVECEVTFK